MHAAPLNQAEYRAYGDVIAARADVGPRTANLGFAKRHDYLSELRNGRGAAAAANLCVFRCEPMVPPGGVTFDVKLLERHAHSTQVFVPMGGVKRYLVIVALGADTPDLATLQAFVATGAQGISYHPAVWHHPLVALDAASDFACLVWEDGGAGDCEVRRLTSPVTVSF